MSRGTLLLRLAAPLQAWGSDAKFERRGTERAPTKSGVIGMLAAALGRRRDESVEDLLQLKFGVRVDQEGELLRDFHTARRDKLAYVTHRYYLTDAVFLAGFEGEEHLLELLEEAVHHPAYPLFLGRRSCPPEGRLSLGIRHTSLLQTLEEEPFQGQKSRRSSGGEQSPRKLRLLIDAELGETQTFMQRDMPISYDFAHRRFGFRLVAERGVLLGSVSVGSGNAIGRRRVEEPQQDLTTEHDPFAEFEGEG